MHPHGSTHGTVPAAQACSPKTLRRSRTWVLGPRVVEVRHVLVLRCTGCTHMTIEVPEPRSLDTLIRCLAGEDEWAASATGLRAGPVVHSAALGYGILRDIQLLSKNRDAAGA